MNGARLKPVRRQLDLGVPERPRAQQTDRRDRHRDRVVIAGAGTLSDGATIEVTAELPPDDGDVRA